MSVERAIAHPRRLTLLASVFSMLTLGMASVTTGAVLIPRVASASVGGTCTEAVAGTVICTAGSGTWTPPAGVTTATAVVEGGHGGTGNSGAAPGGPGGMVSGTLTGLTTSALTILVGGQGGAGAAGGAGGGGGGFNGGGAGGNRAGGGGGGGSEIDAGATRLVVAGGGGGGAPSNPGGGPGGGTNGGTGGGTADATHGGGGPGGGQTLSPLVGLASTGATDCGGGVPCVAGSPGTAGQGGAGGGGGVNNGGGGGGGGFFGGAGGGDGSASAGGGGGGSGHLDASVTGTMTISSRTGDGLVTITYKPPPDNDLALVGVPANITVASLGPAVVNYTPPTATDEETGAVVACVPPSGSTFPIGTTTVTCTATDGDDLNSPVTATFTVTVNFGGVIPGGGGGGGGGGGTPPPSTLALAASPNSGPTGTKITVSSLNPCPPGSTSAVIYLVDSAGNTLASAPASSFSAAGWSGAVTVPKSASPAVDSVFAFCFQGATPIARYGAMTFTVTGGSTHHHRRGHHHNHHHRHH